MCQESTSCEPVRLFVGGLPSSVSSTQIGQRFESFGKVLAVELVPEKTGTITASSPLQPCRGFAYVQLRPNDDASLRRCISMYNGCKWLGGVLRVEPAKLHYTLRLAKEAAEDKAREQSAEAEASIIPVDSLHVPDMPPSLTPFHLPSRDGRKVHAIKPNPVKTFFAPARPARLPQLSWDPLEQPPGLARRHLQLELQQRKPTDNARRVRTMQDAEADAKARAKSAAEQPRKKQKVAKEPEPEVAPTPKEASSSSELAAVDFMSSDDDAFESAPAHDSRFDSSDDDEDVPNEAALLPPEISPSMEAVLAHGSRFDSSDDEDPPTQEARRSGVASLDDEDVPRQGAAQPGDTSHSNEVPVSEHSREHATGDDRKHDRTRSTSEASKEHEGAVKGNDFRHAGMSAAGSQGGRQDADSSSREVSSESPDSSSDAGNAGGGVGGSRAEEGGASELSTSSDSESQEQSPPEHPAEAHGAPAEAEGASVEASDDELEAVPPALIVHASSEDEREMQHQERGTQEQNDGRVQLQQEQEQLLLKALQERFPKGALFRRGADPKEAEAAWAANRDAWIADWKAKRRMALRQQTGPRGRPH